MSGLPAGSATALEPVRRALREAAVREAARVHETAAARAAAILAEASREAARITQAAVTEGEDVARSAAALRSARVRREAHEVVLARQEALRGELLRRVRAAASGLRDDPRYPLLVERLAAQGRAALGPGATVVESPDGGIVAERGSRRLDLSLPVLAAQALEARGQEVGRLWTR